MRVLLESLVEVTQLEKEDRAWVLALKRQVLAADGAPFRLQEGELDLCAYGAAPVGIG